MERSIAHPLGSRAAAPGAGAAARLARALGGLAAALLLGLAASGCANYARPLEVEPARPGTRTTARAALSTLPPPQEKVVVGVYRFRDQTGQYKPEEQGISYSTAVTQGATSILIDALSESGWFVPIEREGLSNLLNERQIIQSVRQQNSGPEGESLGQLPPLLYAGVLLEGGVIGYDTNVLTGGAGARYFGTGGSGEFRKDRVTIYLRAVSTQSGQVLKTVHTSKTIYSQKLDGSFFRFVTADRLLEAEVGYSSNEPNVLAVTAAIDEAVRSLIVEGVRDDEALWSLADPADSTAAAFRAYDRQRRRAAARDVYGRRTTSVPAGRRGIAAGIDGAAMRYEGDYRDPLTRAGAGVHLRYGVGRGLAVGLRAGYGETAADSAFRQPHFAYDAQATYYALPESVLSPFFMLGGGLLQQYDPEMRFFPFLTGGLGVEYLASPRLGLSLSLANTYPLREGLDGVPRGRIHDNLWSVRAGITLYTGFL